MLLGGLKLSKGRLLNNIALIFLDVFKELLGKVFISGYFVIGKCLNLFREFLEGGALYTETRDVGAGVTTLAFAKKERSERGEFTGGIVCLGIF